MTGLKLQEELVAETGTELEPSKLDQKAAGSYFHTVLWFLTSASIPWPQDGHSHCSPLINVAALM